MYSGFAVVAAGAFVLPQKIEFLIVVAFLLMMGLIGLASGRKKNSAVWSHLLAFPVFLTAFQNIYLGLAVNNLSSMELQVLLSINFILYIEYLIIALFKKGIRRSDMLILGVLLIVTLQALILYIPYRTTISAFLSCYRNIVACMVVYLTVKLMSNSIDVEKMYRLLGVIIVAVVVFGFFEYCAGTRVWTALNISKLWPMKGIAVNAWGIPKNWWSSERIGGHQLRRMVASFADPVNLGTFLFAAFVFAWYRRRKVLSVLLFAACIMSVSKGALIGFLVFILVWVWNTRGFKMTTPIILLSVLAAGSLFIVYSKYHSSGSTFAHIRGLLNSIGVLAQHPFGMGVGSVGVMAWMFAAEKKAALVSAETGIGMIISQLGFIGLLAYLAFFGKLLLNASKKFVTNSRTRILLQSLLIAFLINALFNEVALSPNSCMLYFILIGLNESRDKRIKYTVSLEAAVPSIP